MGIVTIGGNITGAGVSGASNLTTVGAIPYVSAVGTLNQDSPGLYWDATNNRLGIGTSSPGVALEIGTPGVLGPRQDVRIAGLLGVDTYAYNTLGSVNTSLDMRFGGYNSGTAPYSAYGVWQTPMNRAIVLLNESTNMIAAFGADGADKRQTYLSGPVGIGTTGPGYALDVSGNTLTARFKDATPTTGATSVLIDIGAAQTAASTVLTLNGVMKYAGTNSTGAGSAALGANSPAVTLTAPYTWIKIVTSDGSTGYIPVWK